MWIIDIEYILILLHCDSQLVWVFSRGIKENGVMVWFLGVRVIGYDYKPTLTPAFINGNDWGRNRASSCNSSTFNLATWLYSGGTDGFSFKAICRLVILELEDGSPWLNNARGILYLCSLSHKLSAHFSLPSLLSSSPLFPARHTLPY